MVNTHYLYEYVMSSLYVLISITINNDAFYSTVITVIPQTQRRD